jgi:UDP-N-acetylmuramate dehydrogenase
MNQEFHKKLIEGVEGNIRFAVALAPLTSFNIGGPADCFIAPAHIKDLQQVIMLLNDLHIDYVVIGNGTNLLITDKGIRGAVIRLQDGFKTIATHTRDEHGADIACGAAVNLDIFIRYCIDKGLAGLEALSGIPGSVGGALKMNAGAFGREMKHTVQQISLVLPDGALETRSTPVLAFDYRCLSIPRGSVITEALLHLVTGEPGALRRTRDEIQQKRKDRYASRFPCAGSIFKNPSGHSAGRLIDEAGLKGVRIGDAQISPHHGNFIINLGRATAQDVMELMQRAIETVRERTGIILEPEICILGEA